MTKDTQITHEVERVAVVLNGILRTGLLVGFIISLFTATQMTSLIFAVLMVWGNLTRIAIRQKIDSMKKVNAVSIA